MKKLAGIAVFALCAMSHSAAHAWFFFFIPTGAIMAAIEGNHCVSASARPGDKILLNGRQWEVKSTNGVSSRCGNTPHWPVIAKLEPILTETELKSELRICAAEGTSVGSRTTIPNVGDVEVISIGGNDCSDAQAPVSARVVRVRGLELLKADRDASQALAPTVSAAPESSTSSLTACVSAQAGPREVLEVPGQGRMEIVRVIGPSAQCLTHRRPWLAEVKHFGAPDLQVSAPPPQAKSVAERLRELKQLRDENLITESVYESKQKEILAGQ